MNFSIRIRKKVLESLSNKSFNGFCKKLHLRYKLFYKQHCHKHKQRQAEIGKKNQAKAKQHPHADLR